MRPVHVTGVGLWAPGFDDVARWQEGAPDAAVLRPRAELIPAATARRASALTHMAAHALGRAIGQAGVAPADVGLVLASVGGELDATFACLDLLLATPPASSPLRFANSLHSSPLGHVSVALGARGFGSALAAPASRVVAMGVLEAWTFLAAEGGHVGLVLVDERWPFADFAPLAVALLLSAEPAAGALGRLGPVVRGEGTLAPAGRGDAALRANPCAGALDLLDAVLAGREGVLDLGDGWAAAWAPAVG